MQNKFKNMQIEHLEEIIQATHFEAVPKDGWIRAIRSSLSMPMNYLAQKLNISPQGVAKLEKNEVLENITLKSLRSLANAMDCELHYSVIPKNKTLKSIIETQAKLKAKEMVDNVCDSMTLENQALENNQQSIELLKQELIDNLNTKLWE